MKIGFSISSLVLASALTTFSYGQAAPTATAGLSSSPASSVGSSSGFSLPSMDGTLHYALSASQIVQFGYFGPGETTGSAALSGDVSYSSMSTKAPFTMIYAGGVILAESGGEGNSTYQNLAASQSVNAGKWILNLSDSVSYLPQSPVTGLSGVPGVGDLGTLPVEGPTGGPVGDVLTYSGNRVSNSISGSAERLITGKTSVSAMGSWTILHFLDGSDGYDTSQVSGEAALNHRIDARDSVSANAVYSTFAYGKDEGGLGIITRGINGVYTRVLSKSLSMNLSAGPQWVSSSYSDLIPDSLNVAASAGLTYSHKLTTASVSYYRGVNPGSGVQAGGLSNTVSGGFGHSITREWLIAASGAYSHTEGLANSSVAPPPGVTIPLGGNFTTVFGGFQVSHSISRTLSAYASYSAQHQSYDATYTGTNAFSGLSQTFGIGISYTPRATRLGQF